MKKQRPSPKSATPNPGDKLYYVTALELSGYQEFDDLAGADWLVRQWKKDKDITRIRVVDGLDKTTSGYRLIKEYRRNADGKWRGGNTSGRSGL